MKTIPSPTGNSALITKKEFWVAAYLAALHRVSANEALAEADQALSVAEQRWQDPEYVGHWKYKHDFPLGFIFDESKEG